MNIDIRIPYTTRPQMSRHLGAIFNPKPDPRYIEQKVKELHVRGSDLYAVEDLRFVDRASRFCGFPPTHDILELALCLEEDFAILHHGRLVAVCFCFPSGWIPSERIGQTLAQIHEPVADSQYLVRASPQLAKTMAEVSSSNFTRTVWTLTNNSELSNHPAAKNSQQPQSLDDLYFRWEVQTTAAMGDGNTSLFFVKVNVVPFREVKDNWEKIKQSINSMSHEILEYKNLVEIKKIVNEFI